MVLVGTIVHTGATTALYLLIIANLTFVFAHVIRSYWRCVAVANLAGILLSFGWRYASFDAYATINGLVYDPILRTFTPGREYDVESVVGILVMIIFPVGISCFVLFGQRSMRLPLYSFSTKSWMILVVGLSVAAIYASKL